MMNACPEKVIRMMDDYLDGEISPSEEKELKDYLQSCSDCRKIYQELTKTIAFVQSASHVQAPAGFVEKTMASLPKEPQRAGIKRFMRHHPLMVAAALFVILMSAAMMSSFSDDQQFAFTKQEHLVVEGETVVVPAGQTVVGDITIRNGDLRVDGELEGNATIVNGQYMASSGVINGEVEEIDQVFEWLWYTIKGTFRDAVSFFGGNDQSNDM